MGNMIGISRSRDKPINILVIGLDNSGKTETVEKINQLLVGSSTSATTAVESPPAVTSTSPDVPPTPPQVSSRPHPELEPVAYRPQQHWRPLPPTPCCYDAKDNVGVTNKTRSTPINIPSAVTEEGPAVVLPTVGFNVQTRLGAKNKQNAAAAGVDKDGRRRRIILFDMSGQV